MITGDGTVTRVESRFGSFVASGVCKVSGDGEAGTSVIMGGSAVAGADDVVSSTWSGTAAGMGNAANTRSGAGAGSTTGSTESVAAGVVSVVAIAGGSAVVMGLPAIGSVAGV